MFRPAQIGREERPGFTLVELLVVIAIIGVLVALLLPAVQSSREAARRTGCVNKQHNLALALLNYEGANGRFPMGSHRRVEGGGRPEYQTNQASWIARILPQIEQGALYDQIDFDAEPGDQGDNVPVMGTRLDVVRCPSDSNELIREGWISDGGHPLAAFAPTNYVVCIGDTDEAHLYTGIYGINSTTRVGQITDGTSNTMMISECKLGDPLIKYYGGGGRYYQCLAGSAPRISTYNVEPRGFSWFYSQVAQSWNYTTILTPNDSLTTNHECQMWSDRTVFAARSRHPGGVNVAMCDGSVRFVVDEIDYDMWQYLGAMQDGETTGVLN